MLFMHYYSFMNILLMFSFTIDFNFVMCVFLSFSIYLFPFSRFSASILFHVFANNEKKVVETICNQKMLK